MKSIWKWLNHWYTKVCVALFGATISVLLSQAWGVSVDEVHVILLAIALFLLTASLIVNVILWRRLHRP
jgi:hypothetical protein